MRTPTKIDGLGVHIYSEDGVTFLDLLFEVLDAALDGETGEYVNAGMRRILRLQEGETLRPLAEYEAVAKQIADAGFPEQGIEQGKLRPITWAYYIAKGYDRCF